jgi:hypothetical protein
MTRHPEAAPWRSDRDHRLLSIVPVGGGGVDGTARRAATLRAGFFLAVFVPCLAVFLVVLVPFFFVVLLAVFLVVFLEAFFFAPVFFFAIRNTPVLLSRPTS